MKHITLYKTVRKQPLTRRIKRGKKGMIFLPRKLIGKKIKLTIEIWDKPIIHKKLHYPYI